MKIIKEKTTKTMNTIIVTRDDILRLVSRELSLNYPYLKDTASIKIRTPTDGPSFDDALDVHSLSVGWEVDQ